MKIGTLTTGAAVQTEINLNYLPSVIWYIAATQLTGLKVEVLGEGVICDLDADGLSTVGKGGRVGDVSNLYVIPLATGLVSGKNVVMTFTNSAAQTPDVYGFSTSKNGRFFVKNLQTKVFANSGIEIDGGRFDSISFENGTAASDELEVRYADGLSQKFNLLDLQAQNSISFNVAGTDEDYYLQQNGRITSVSYIPNADTTLYLTKKSAV